MFVKSQNQRHTNRALALLIVVAGAGLVFAYKHNRNNTTSNVVVSGQKQEEIPDRPLFVPEVKEEATTPVERKVKGAYVLSITGIGVKAPIVTNVDGLDEKTYLKSLQNGVAHYKGTPLPGNKGNAFIFGHSSYYEKDPGQYKDIFKDLGTMKKGDTFTILVNDKDTYTYSVFESALTTDKETKWLDESKDERVTLMTCWPPGTYAKRWVVQGKRI